MDVNGASRSLALWTYFMDLKASLKKTLNENSSFSKVGLLAARDDVFAAMKEEGYVKLEYRLYRRRWLVLFVYSLVACFSGMLWLTFSPIRSKVRLRSTFFLLQVTSRILGLKKS